MKPSSAPPTIGGRYVYYGIREHGMAAAMNGMALHGGVIPYGGTFLVFTDYCRPSIRLSALMGQRVDLRDDPRLRSASARTARPISRSNISPPPASFPISTVLRPCDAIETAECWQLALASTPQARACWP
ncbi:MAG: hypothetical protein V9G14_11200 [Cypionkella sp.]